MRLVHGLLFLSLFLLPLLAVAGGRRQALAGEWSPITDLMDPHIKEIAEFAVTEHDKQTGEKLTLVNILVGEFQIVNGYNFRLVLAANDGSSSKKNYQAIVWEKEEKHFRKLISFKAI